jgi:succinyl-CoA synthetase alpha subunit
MSILLDENSRIVVQGAAGVEGRFHLRQMVEYGSNVVAGVDPMVQEDTIEGIPAYKTLRDAVADHSPDTSVVFVPAPFAFGAMMEAIDHNIGSIIVITEGIPVRDVLKVKRILSRRPQTRLIGPNCPGVISPGKSKAGIMPGHIHMPGTVGVVSRSGTLTYQIVHTLTEAGIGQSSCLGIGGDPVVGSDFVDILKLFKEDPHTSCVVLIGEIGGTAEEEAAEYIREGFDKEVVAFVAGVTAPPEKRMGHAGAIISGGRGTAKEKIKSLKASGVDVASIPDEIAEMVKRYG